MQLPQSRAGRIPEQGWQVSQVAEHTYRLNNKLDSFEGMFPFSLIFFSFFLFFFINYLE